MKNEYKYYTIYKITNLFNDKIYIGYHSTNNLNDDYMGSGLRIKRLIKKYGYISFRKEILFIFDNEEDMINKEIELITPEFILQENNYNLVPGGGSFTSTSGKIAVQKLRDRLKSDPEFRAKWSETSRKNCLGIIRSQQSKERMSLSQKGRNRSALHKSKISRTVSKLIWITNSETLENMRIPPQKLSEYTQSGWKRGRYMLEQHIKNICPSALGKLWMYNENLKKTILTHKQSIEPLISQGWKMGRKTFKHKIGE